VTRDISRLRRLKNALAGARRLLVLTHDHPDPDAIASAWALGKIVRAMPIRRVMLAYGGIIGRSENRAMLEVLRIPMRSAASVSWESFDALALVDSQPGAGNNSLPPGRLPTIVFDHHPCGHGTRAARFHDVREGYGATATILFEYLQAAGIEPDRRLATAIFHAIRSETQNLGREAGQADARAFLCCFPLVDNEALSRIEHARLPKSYFAMIDRAIDGTTIHGEAVVTILGEVRSTDMVAQFADLMIRLEGIGWVLAIGRRGGDLLLSVRTNHRRRNAGRVIRTIVGPQGVAGGHDMIAGGRLIGQAGTETAARRAERSLARRFLSMVGAAGTRSSRLARLQ